MKQFSIQEAISFGWNTFKKYPWLLLGITLTVTVLPSLLQYALQLPFKTDDPDNYPPLMMIGTLVSSFVSLYLTVGVIKIYLKLIDNKKIHYQDLFNVQADEYIHYFLASIVYGLIVIAGIILLIIPGIYWGIKYQYYSYLVIDKHLSVMDSIKESGNITRGNIMQLFLFSAVIILISLLGLLALLVGVFVVSPVVGIAQAYVYRKLSSSKK